MTELFDDLAMATSNRPGAYEAPDITQVAIPREYDHSEHRVKIAYQVKRGRAKLYVWECICGASSALHTSKGLANASYLEHKENA
jgi:hypothetical protein